MDVVDGVALLKNQGSQRSVLTIGNFDGLHLGHREIISRVVKHTRGSHARSVVMTFSPHPKQVLFPYKVHPRLFDREDQEEQISHLGIELLVREPFTQELSKKDPEQFLKDYIVEPFSPTTLVVGYDFAFGAKRMGTLEMLGELSQKYDFRLEVVPAIKMGGRIVSSSEIKKVILEGDVELAEEMLSRSFYLRGAVQYGKNRGGHLLGFPTANISCRTDEIIPKIGIYITETFVRGQLYRSVTSIGLNPTFKDAEVYQEGVSPLKIETHILDFNHDIYNEKIKVFFKKYLREEKKFSNLEELTKAIRGDIQMARDYFRK